MFLSKVGDRGCCVAVSVSVTIEVVAGMYVLAREGAVRTHDQFVLEDAVPLC